MLQMVRSAARERLESIATELAAWDRVHPALQATLSYQAEKFVLCVRRVVWLIVASVVRA